MGSSASFLDPQAIASEFGVRKGMQIADFGVGAGHFALELARLVGDEGKVHAVDIQQSALEAVRSRARQEGMYNIELVWSDLETPRGSKLADRSQDIVLLANILHQAPDKAAILREARRVTKARGKIIVIEWVGESPMGPDKTSRIPPEALLAIAAPLDLEKQGEFSAGACHYGIIFSPHA
ncbi:MAG: class I SAM-dependent methyltransferase [bacterium]|nr:class I SAM-dependent methyltransferase [bacterium]MDZ4295782.1 class I SAM-dependent methyltransferase [Patescibacteria group bacterium]